MDRLSKLDVLRLGFGGMIVLLAMSALEAYRIQSSSAQHSVDIYHRFVGKGDALLRIRRLVFQGSIQIRDLFLSERPERREIFRGRVEEQRRESRHLLAQLDWLTGSDQTTAELRGHIEAYWSVLAKVLQWPELDAREGYEYIQREVVPLRNATSEVINAFADADRQALENSEAEFAANSGSAARRLLAVLGALLALGVVLVWLSLRHADGLERQSDKRLAEVTRARFELQQLSARLLEVQEEERRRLSRELHDEIGQMLTALRIEISNALAGCRTSAPEAAARLEQARTLAENTLGIVRNISLLLRPSLLDDLGLGPALQWQLEEFSRRSGIRAELAGEAPEAELPDTHKTCIYRVVQEALHNAEKHAGASLVRVSMTRRQAELVVAIEDDGRGFEPERKGSPTLGIAGMRERAAMLGGKLALESAPGRGTRLVLILSLASPPAAQAHGAHA